MPFNFSVPQFIEIEDKVVGPFTFKQFVYLAGGVAICFLAWRFLPFLIAILIVAPVAVLSLALAFYKINNQPFANIMASAVKYWLGGKLYIWKKEEKKVVGKKIESKAPGSISPSVSRLSESKLNDIAWSLDVHEKLK